MIWYHNQSIHLLSFKWWDVFNLLRQHAEATFSPKKLLWNIVIVITLSWANTKQTTHQGNIESFWQLRTYIAYGHIACRALMVSVPEWQSSLARKTNQDGSASSWSICYSGQVQRATGETWVDSTPNYLSGDSGSFICPILCIGTTIVKHALELHLLLSCPWAEINSERERTLNAKRC